MRLDRMPLGGSSNSVNETRVGGGVLSTLASGRLAVLGALAMVAAGCPGNTTPGDDDSAALPDDDDMFPPDDDDSGTGDDDDSGVDDDDSAEGPYILDDCATDNDHDGAPGGDVGAFLGQPGTECADYLLVDRPKSEDGRDCDDWNSAVHPGAPEVADGIDNNCNGLVDEVDGDDDDAGDDDSGTDDDDAGDDDVADDDDSAGDDDDDNDSAGDDDDLDYEDGPLDLTTADQLDGLGSPTLSYAAAELGLSGSSVQVVGRLTFVDNGSGAGANLNPFVYHAAPVSFSTASGPVSTYDEAVPFVAASASNPTEVAGLPSVLTISGADGTIGLDDPASTGSLTVCEVSGGYAPVQNTGQATYAFYDAIDSLQGVPNPQSFGHSVVACQTVTALDAPITITSDGTVIIVASEQ